MSKITHIFFDLYGTLIDTAVMGACYSAVYGRLMAERYGRQPGEWAEANRRIVADWDSYYADLDFDGENGLDDMWEGLYRTTRAMFRIVSVPEPSREALHQLSRWVPGEVPKYCDALYPDAKSILVALHQTGYVLGVTSHALVTQVEATLIGGGVRDLFAGPIIGPEVVGQYRKDALFYRYASRAAGVKPGACLVVDDHPDALRAASALGMATYNAQRDNAGAVGLTPLLDFVTKHG